MKSQMRNFTGERFFFETLTSTNDRMHEMLAQTIPAEGTIIHTSFQSGGRGHMGNKWESEKGKNLLFTILLLPDFLATAKQFELSKIISLALLDVVGKHCKNVLIKWPNDILAGNRKMAGILIENVVTGDRLSRCVAGIGLNVNQETFSSEIPDPTSLILETGCQFDMTELLDQLTERIESWYNILYEGELENIDRAYIRKLYGWNEMREFIHDSKKFRARIAGVDTTGELILELSDGGRKTFGFKEIEYA